MLVVCLNLVILLWTTFADFVRIGTCSLQVLLKFSGLRNGVFGPAEVKKSGHWQATESFYKNGIMVGTRGNWNYKNCPG